MKVGRLEFNGFLEQEVLKMLALYGHSNLSNAQQINNLNKKTP
jgi:hypothetical protein